MTVAADDGVMPQTREHAAVLEALGVRAGVVAVTKSDLADPEIAMIEASELLPGRRGDPGIGAHRGRGARAARGAGRRGRGAGQPSRGRRGRAPSRRPRVHDPGRRDGGHGHAVVGGDRARRRARGAPRRPARARARRPGPRPAARPCRRGPAGGAQPHRRGGRRRRPRRRGRVGGARTLRPAYLLDAELQFGGEEPEHGDRVQIHHGTREAPARLAWLGGRFWQVRLEQPLVAAGRRPARRAPDRAAGHARRRRRARPPPRRHGPSRDLLTRLERLSRGEPASPSPALERAVPRARAGREPRASAALGLGARAGASVCARPGSSRRSTPSSTPRDLAALRDAGRAARVTRTCTTTPMRWRTSARG